jgi:predicted metal-dependent hydrolase
LLQLQLDDSLAIPVRTSRRAKQMRLVASIRGVEAIVPEGFSAERLQEFVQSKRGWIAKMAQYYSAVRERADHEDGTIYYLGQKYRYRIVRDRFPSAIVSNSLKSITFHVTDIRSYKKEIEQWYKHQTARIISERLPQVSAKTGLSYNKVSIKKQKSRWGSCSKKRNLNFNLLLAAAPVEVIDYVIVHELAHTVELNHSKKFWELVQKADSAFREHRTWLEDHSPAIKIEGL